MNFSRSMFCLRMTGFFGRAIGSIRGICGNSVGDDGVEEMHEWKESSESESISILG